MKKKKAALRAQMKQVRAKLHGHRKEGNEAARKVAARLLMLPELAVEVQRGIRAENIEAHIVAGFMPIGTELDCHYILKALSAVQCRIALPVITGKDRPLTFREWNLEDELMDGPYGTCEPKTDCPDVMPDIILVPLLGFDERGHRLGYGGGFYDRTLAGYRAKGHDFTAIGAAYDGQKQDNIPADCHDQPLDIIVTEKKVYRP